MIHQPDPKGKKPHKQNLSPTSISRLLFTFADLSAATSLSLRTLRRMRSAGELPGVVVRGRRVFFVARLVQEWIDAGMPAITRPSRHGRGS